MTHWSPHTSSTMVAVLSNHAFQALRNLCTVQAVKKLRRAQSRCRADAEPSRAEQSHVKIAECRAELLQLGGIALWLRSGHMALLTRCACRNGGHVCTGPGRWFPGTRSGGSRDLIHTLPPPGEVVTFVRRSGAIGEVPDVCVCSRSVPFYAPGTHYHY